MPWYISVCLGQSYRKFCPLSFFRIHVDDAVMNIDDLTYNGQTEARSGFLCRKIWLEYFFKIRS